MTPEQMKKRTQEFALRVIKAVSALGRDRASDTIGRQLLRSGTSVGANYRSACRSRSDADFLSRMGIVEEEADETIYWMEILVRSGLVPAEKMNLLVSEANELLSIVVASINTVKRRVRPKATAKSEIRNPNSEIGRATAKSEIRNPKSEMA